MTTLSAIVLACLVGGALSVLAAAACAFAVLTTAIPRLVRYAVGVMLATVFLGLLPERRRPSCSQMDAVLDVNGFNLNDILAIEPDSLKDVSHEHDDAVKSFVFRAHAPFSLPALEIVITELLHRYGPDLLRYKGILHVQGETRRIILQGVRMLMKAVPGRT